MHAMQRICSESQHQLSATELVFVALLAGFSKDPPLIVGVLEPPGREGDNVEGIAAFTQDVNSTEWIHRTACTVYMLMPDQVQQPPGTDLHVLEIRRQDAVVIHPNAQPKRHQVGGENADLIYHHGCCGARARAIRRRIARSG